MLEIIGQGNLERSVRERAKNLVVAIIMSKPKKVSAHNLVADILKVVFSLVIEPLPTEEDEFFAMAEEGGNPQLMAQEMLDMLVFYLDPAPIYDLCLMNVEPMLAANNEHLRQGGLLILSTLAEMCDNSMKSDLGSLLHAVCACFGDAHANVREAAARALTQFADHLQPEILDYHAVVLPPLYSCLEASREPLVLGKALVALQVYVQNMEGEHLAPYLDGLMTKLLQLLQSVESMNVQITVLGAISAVASAARKVPGSFVPYFPVILTVLQSALGASDDSFLRLRARATECAGDVAIAVGREVFEPYFEVCAIVLYICFSINNFLT
jgi:hypothetical protein